MDTELLDTSSFLPLRSSPWVLPKLSDLDAQVRIKRDQNFEFGIAETEEAVESHPLWLGVKSVCK